MSDNTTNLGICDDRKIPASTNSSPALPSGETAAVENGKSHTDSPLSLKSESKPVPTPVHEVPPKSSATSSIALLGSTKGEPLPSAISVKNAENSQGTESAKQVCRTRNDEELSDSQSNTTPLLSRKMVSADTAKIEPPSTTLPLIATLSDIRAHGNSASVVKSQPTEVLAYSRDEQSQISISRQLQKVYQPKASLLKRPIRERIDLGVGSEEYRNLRSLPENKSLPEMAHAKHVAMKLHEQKTGRKIAGDMIGSRRNFIALIQGLASLRIVYFDDQLYILEDLEQKLRVDRTLMLGHNFEALVTNQEYPTKGSPVKYDIMIRHEFENPRLSLVISCDVDAVEKEGDHGLENNIEIKCKAHDRYIDSAVLQCHIAGGNKLYVGRRRADCSLSHIYKVPINLNSSQHKAWDRDLAQICSFIVDNVRRMCKQETSLAQELILRLERGVLHLSFADKVTKLPQWFIDHRQLLQVESGLKKMEL